MTAQDCKDSPDAISCPPLVFVGALGLGLLLNWLLPAWSFSSESFRVAGMILSLIGNIIGVWAIFTLLRAGTNVRPDRPVTALVTNGPFRYSRNPLYVALTILYVAAILVLGTIWPLATLVPTLVMVHWKIVRREEQYLEARFGDTYRAYKARVHRWI